MESGRHPRRRRPDPAALAALLVLWMLSAVAAAADGSGRLLVIHEGKAVAALAADGEAVWFAVVPPPPLHTHAQAPPAFIPVRADGRSAAGTVVLGLWTPKGVRWLTALPADMARGGDSAYAVMDILPQRGGLWVTGGANRPEQPIGRYYLARVDARGRARIVDADGGPAAFALAAAGKRPYVARDRTDDAKASVARLAWPGRWATAITVTGPRRFFSWTAGHGLAAAADGVWGVAHFVGTVRVGDAVTRSPALEELPFHAGPDGGLPPLVLRTLRQMLRAQLMPPVGAGLVVRLDARGRLVSLTTLAPDALHVGVSTGDQGLDPAWIDPTPLLATDPSGRAFLFGRYRHAIRAGEVRLVADEAAEAGDHHCFLASWEAGGALRWLRDVPRCTGSPVALVAERGRVVAVTGHAALVLDPETGAVRSRRALPRLARTRGTSDFGWTAADVAGDRLVLGGIFRGDAELLGRRLELRRTGAVLAIVPLDAGAAGD